MLCREWVIVFILRCRLRALENKIPAKQYCRKHKHNWKVRFSLLVTFEVLEAWFAKKTYAYSWTLSLLLKQYLKHDPVVVRSGADWRRHSTHSRSWIADSNSFSQKQRLHQKCQQRHIKQTLHTYKCVVSKLSCNTTAPCLHITQADLLLEATCRPCNHARWTQNIHGAIESIKQLNRHGGGGLYTGHCVWHSGSWIKNAELLIRRGKHSLVVAKIRLTGKKWNGLSSQTLSQCSGTIICWPSSTGLT